MLLESDEASMRLLSKDGFRVHLGSRADSAAVIEEYNTIKYEKLNLGSLPSDTNMRFPQVGGING